MILTRSNSRNCKMTFIIGRDFAERQILKKWKWPYFLNWVEYFDKLLRKCWYWQDLAQEIAKWHFSLVESLPSSKFWKSDNGAISWTEWDIVIKFCIHIAYTLILTRCTPWDCQMTFEIGWVFAQVKILKKSETIAKWHLLLVEALQKWKVALSLELSGIFDRLLRKHWCWQDLAKEIVKCHFSSVDVLPRSKFWKVKMAISLELSGILWRNFAYTLVLTRCSQWDCQMTFGIGRDFAEVQILKKVKHNPLTVRNSLIKFCRQFDVEKI